MDPFVFDKVVAIAEEFYTAHLSLERVKGVDLVFEKLYGFGITSIFRYETLFYCACLRFPLQIGDVIIELDYSSTHRDPTHYMLLGDPTHYMLLGLWSGKISTRYTKLK